jgi:hypothetical protein
LKANAVNVFTDEVLTVFFQREMVPDVRQLGVLQAAKPPGFGPKGPLKGQVGIQIFFNGRVFFVFDVPAAVDGPILALSQEADDAVAFVEEFAWQEGH